MQFQPFDNDEAATAWLIGEGFAISTSSERLSYIHSDGRRAYVNDALDGKSHTCLAIVVFSP